MSVTAPRRAKFPWRALLYSVILLYLVGDLYWFNGPLKQKIDSRKPFTKYSKERALKNGWVATVNTEPITLEQLELAAKLFLYRRGKSVETASKLDLQIARVGALKELVQDTIIRQHAEGDEFVPDPKRVEERLRIFESQFADAEELEGRSAAQGLTPATRRELLKSQLAGQLWLEDLLTPDAAVIEKAARDWFDQNREKGKGLFAPDVVRARHIFLSTVSEDTAEREQLAREIHRRLVSEEANFTDLAEEFSDDARNKDSGGDLDWFSADRMPRDFSDIAFGLRTGEISAPFRSSIGWHIVEVTDRKPSRELTFEDLKPEITAFLETRYRRENIEEYLKKLETASSIEWFDEVLKTGLSGSSVSD